MSDQIPGATYDHTDLKDFENLFKANYKRLCLVSYRIVNNKDTAEDVVQDVFFKFWNEKDKISIKSTVKGYLYQSVVNASLNQTKKNQKYASIESAEDIQVSVIPESNSEINQSELKEKIKEAIDQLPPKCKAIFIMSRYEGLKYQEIAGLLQISVKTVENQMGIALEKLRCNLREYFNRHFLLSVIALVLFI
ncbi:MAG: RNA polymerase sigma-70 factor [Cytophagaceae bacterium]|nr:RNA polymerase sigma-70 factor [Cytophagaceae bacterium]